MGQQQQQPPKYPQPSKEYERGVQVQMKYLPQQVQQDLALRYQYDPQFIEQALGLQHAYDPALAYEQISALARRDPQWLGAHAMLGARVQDVLARGYLGAAPVDPRYEKAYGALAQDVTGQELRGSTASPDTMRNMTQAILSRQPGLSYGAAQNMAAAVYTGQRGEALRQQRQQATGQFLGITDPNRLAQQSELQALGVGGTYLSGPTTTSMINQIQGVTPPRALAYVNPNAGYMGQQFALQNYQNQLGYSQMQQGNPWMSALSGAGSGAMAGSSFGPYGAAAGALIGGAGGYFGYSDARLKHSISRTGAVTRDGIPIVEFNYLESDKRYRGVTAQDVEKVRPDAVFEFGGYKMVAYHKLGINLEEA